MAADQVAVMASMGFERFAVVGHDRGARVAHRMALDHAGRVELLVLLDVLPTSYVYENVDRLIATAYYHWFFLIQPGDMPERLIAADPLLYLHSLLANSGGSLDRHDPEALAAYEKAFAGPAARAAMIGDYRAGASIDLDHDAADEKITAPTLVLWGEKGTVGGTAESPVEIWRSRAADHPPVTGRAVPEAGHFLVEDNLAVTVGALREFLDHSCPAIQQGRHW